MSAPPHRSNSKSPLGTLVHLAGLFFSVLGAGFVYFFTKNPVTKTNAANALNWQLLVLATGIALVVVSIGIGTLVNPFLSVAAALASLALGAINLTVCLFATIKAYGGKPWRYPLAPTIVDPRD